MTALLEGRCERGASGNYTHGGKRASFVLVCVVYVSVRVRVRERKLHLRGQKGACADSREGGGGRTRRTYRVYYLLLS